ncbi:MAG: EamA family transporter [Verrucomicrobia bacterium]|jgi:drug/metabolite transporter (DMT)-like permease|nr:EamA family transporter [Verrucomicrobiota bacterium]
MGDAMVQRAGITYLLIASLLWSFSFGLIGRYLTGIDAPVVACIRLSVSFMLFAPLLRLRGVRLAYALKLVGLGAIQYGVMYVAYIRAYQFLQGHQVAVFTIFTPLFVTLIHDRLNRRFHRAFLLASLLAVAGAALLVWWEKDVVAALKGVLLVQFANLCFAFGQVGYKQLRDREAEQGDGAGVSEDAATFALLYFGAAVCTGLFSGLTTDWGSLSFSRTQMLVLLYLGVVPSGLGFFFWNLGARRVNAGVLAAFNNIKIPLAVLVSLIVFRERTAWVRLLIGGIAIIGGVVYAGLTRAPSRSTQST